MFKSFAAAALAVAASAVSAAEVISINFTQDGYGALDDAGIPFVEMFVRGRFPGQK